MSQEAGPQYMSQLFERTDVFVKRTPFFLAPPQLLLLHVLLYGTE